MKCRHCKQNEASRPRGLCWTCYYRPGVREQYPSTSRYASRGVGTARNALPLPAQPTNALPGTAEKLAILEQRAAAGVQLFHPNDAGMVPVLALAS